MPSLSFEGLPPYALLSGFIEGTMVLEVDRPCHFRDLSIRLDGAEQAMAVVQEGKVTRDVKETTPFLQALCDLSQVLPVTPDGLIQPGRYRVPFKFAIPASAEPSLGADAPGNSGFFGARGRLDVTYEVTARMDVPWWIDPVRTVQIPVFSPRRVLGQFPTLRAAQEESGLDMTIAPAAPGAVLPGTTLSLNYAVANPRSKELTGLTLTVERLVEFDSQGVARVAHGPTFQAEDLREPAIRTPFSGICTFEFPNDASMTGPFAGAHYRTYWQATAVLHRAWGLLDLKASAPFIPA